MFTSNREVSYSKLSDRQLNLDLAKEKAKLTAKQIQERGAKALTDKLNYNPKKMLDLLGWGPIR